MVYKNVFLAFILTIFLAPSLAFATVVSSEPSNDMKDVEAALTAMNLSMKSPKGWFPETYEGNVSFAAEGFTKLSIYRHEYDPTIWTEALREASEPDTKVIAKGKMKIAGVQGDYIEASSMPFDKKGPEATAYTKAILFHSTDKKYTYVVAMQAIGNDWKTYKPVMESAVKSLKLLKSKTVQAKSSGQKAGTSMSTYTNTAYGYSFQFPKDWVLEPHRSVVDSTNKLRSIIEVHNKKNTSVVRVIVNEDEKLLKHSALKTQKVTIAGKEYVAYLFPQGYECGMASPGAKDCSFFVIPIYRNGVWYEIYGAGNAKTVTKAYKDILSTFVFENE